MKLTILFLPGILALANQAWAQNIYKCAGPEGVAYRDTPCAAQQQEQIVGSFSRNVNLQIQDGRATEPAFTKPATVFSATRLFIGMTDTQVLNLPSWGRPAKINRSRADHAWREQWVYNDRGTGDERRLLYFENGRLMAQEDAPAPAAIQARVTIE